MVLCSLRLKFAGFSQRQKKVFFLLKELRFVLSQGGLSSSCFNKHLTIFFQFLPVVVSGFFRLSF